MNEKQLTYRQSFVIENGLSCHEQVELSLFLCKVNIMLVVNIQF